jgi:hypothetical protein
MPPTKAKRQPDTLAQRFELEETFLSSPNTAALKSAVIRAIDRRTGDPVVLKYWEKTGTTVDADFKELWRMKCARARECARFPARMKLWPKFSLQEKATMHFTSQCRSLRVGTGSPLSHS